VQYTFLVYALALPIFVLFLVFVPNPKNNESKQISIKFHKETIILTLLTLLVGISYMGATIKIPTLLVEKYHLHPEVSRNLLTILAISGIFSGFLFGELVKKFKNLTLSIMLLFMTCGSFIFAIFQSSILFTIGAIFEDGKDRREGGLGRIPIQIKADFRKDYAIVLFWQRGKIDGSIVSLEQGKPYSERRMGHCAVEVSSPKEFGRVSLDILRSLREKQGKCHYIGTGIVLPGIVDRERKCILSSPLGMDIECGKKVISELEESGEEAIGLFNDNAILGYAAMERLGLQEKNFLYVNLSEGVGAAYFMGGEVFGGAGGICAPSASSDLRRLCDGSGKDLR